MSSCPTHYRNEQYYTLTQDCSVSIPLSLSLFTFQLILFVIIATVSAYNLSLAYRSERRIRSSNVLKHQSTRFLSTIPSTVARSPTKLASQRSQPINRTKQLISLSRCCIVVIAMLHALHCLLIVSTGFESIFTYPSSTSLTRLFFFALPAITWQGLSLLFTLILYRILIKTRMKGGASVIQRNDRVGFIVLIALLIEVIILNLYCFMQPISTAASLSSQTHLLNLLLLHYGALSVLCCVSNVVLGLVLSWNLLKSLSTAVHELAYRLRNVSIVLSICYMTNGVVLMLLGTDGIVKHEFYFHLVEYLNSCMILCQLYFLRTNALTSQSTASLQQQHQYITSPTTVNYALNSANITNSSLYLTQAATTGELSQLEREQGNGSCVDGRNEQIQIDMDMFGIQVKPVVEFQEEVYAVHSSSHYRSNSAAIASRTRNKPFDSQRKRFNENTRLTSTLSISSTHTKQQQQTRLSDSKTQPPQQQRENAMTRDEKLDVDDINTTIVIEEVQRSSLVSPSAAS